jgi:hypothetical protein
LLAELLDLQNPNSLASSSTFHPSSTPLGPSPTTPHRYLRLPHPRNDKPSLYLVYRPAEESPGEIVLELQSINPDKKRSWFYGEQVVGGQSRRLVFPPAAGLELIRACVSRRLLALDDTHKPSIPRHSPAHRPNYQYLQLVIYYLAIGHRTGKDKPTNRPLLTFRRPGRFPHPSGPMSVAPAIYSTFFRAGEEQNERGRDENRCGYGGGRRDGFGD